MTNDDKLFRKRLVDLIEWYDSEFKFPKSTAKYLLDTLKNRIKNSGCPSCDENDDVSDEEVIVKKKEKKKYPVQYWKCEVCNVSVQIYNKSHHLKTKKHTRNVLENQQVNINV